MFYTYSCCVSQDVQRSMREPEPGVVTCTACDGLTAKRIYTVPMLALSGCKFDPHYSVGLGQVVKSQREVNAICKEKGLVELGNEKAPVIKKAQRKVEWDDYAKAAQELGLQDEGRDDLAILKEELGKAQDRPKKKRANTKWSKPNLPPIKVDVSGAKMGLT